MEVIKQTNKKPKRPAWFEDFYQNDYKPFKEEMQKRLAWFEDFYQNDYKPFQQLVIKKFEEISTILANVIKLNNLKTSE